MDLKFDKPIHPPSRMRTLALGELSIGIRARLLL